MKAALKQVTYDAYLIVLVILTFLSFIGPLEGYLMPLLVAVGFLFVMANKSVFYLIPIPFFVQMSFSGLRDNVSVTTMYSVVLGVLIVIDIIKNRHLTRRGRLTIPLLILMGLSVFTHINSPDLFTTFAGFIQIASILALYYYFINTLNKEEDNFRYVAKMLLYISVLVSLEMMYVIYESGELATRVIQTRQIDLGWENLNVIIYANLISIPLIAYLIHESKIKFFYMILAVISMIGIFLTLSRSSVLTLGVMIVLLIPIMFILSNQRLYLIWQGIVFLILLGIAGYIVEMRFELISGYIEALQSRDLTYADDRIALLKVAWDRLLEYPIFGSGGLYSSRFELADAGYQSLNYHNTVAQASTLGFLGIGAFFYLILRKVEIIMLSKSPIKWYVLILMIATIFINGALQPMYFYATYMALLFLIIACVEIQIPETKPGLKLT